MHKVLWDSIIKCRIHRVSRHNKDERAAYCAGCPLGSECGEVDEQEAKEGKMIKFKITVKKEVK